MLFDGNRPNSGYYLLLLFKYLFSTIVLIINIYINEVSMPNGKAHASATILLAAGLGFISISLRDDTALTTAAVVGGCLAGLVLTPDLDVDRGSISHHIVKHSAGFLIGFAWHLFWFPYSRIMPHRSWWSHMPIFSTFFRVGYLFALPAVLWLLANTVFVMPAFKIPTWSWFPTAFIGLILADTLHALMDITDSFVKRRVYRLTRIRW
jgi:uncharacterized metal-binding protein